MGQVMAIGIDIAKLVFQIHGVDADGTVVIRRRVGRARVLEFFADLPPCRVGLEACATAHHALANKLARIAWSVLAHGRNFEVTRVAAANPQSV